MEKILLALFQDRSDQFESALQRIRDFHIPEERIQTMSNNCHEPEEISVEDFFSSPDTTCFVDPAAEIVRQLCSWGLTAHEADQYLPSILQGGQMMRITIENEEQDELVRHLEESGATEILRRAQFAQIECPVKAEVCPPFLSLEGSREFEHEAKSWEDLKKNEETKKARIRDQFKKFSGKFEDDSELPEVRKG